MRASYYAQVERTLCSAHAGLRQNSYQWTTRSRRSSHAQAGAAVAGCIRLIHP